MMTTAREVMFTEFVTISPDIPVIETFKVFREHQKIPILGMMVADEKGRLVGMLSMYDIFLLLRPKHVEVWGGMDDITIAGMMENTFERAKSILVGDIMTTDLITITPDTHVMTILDIMTKNHVFRLPVLEEEKVIGIVYAIELFYYLLEKSGV